MTEKMKPSGIGWIGDIPYSWKCKKLKYLISGPLQYGANEEGCDFDEAYPRYIRITDIEDNNRLKSDGKQSLLPAVAAPYILNDGDVLFARSGATVGKTFIYSSEVGCAAFAGYLIRASVDNKQILPKYLYYCTINDGYDNWKNSVFTQATIQNIGADKYAQFTIAFPSIMEQQCIVDFLNTQCAKIDSVIADIEKQIETLQKYKKSLITEAVTKGLDRSVPMKDCGVDWVGRIPAHWSVKRLKYVMDNFDSQRKPIEAQNRSQDGDILYDYYGASGVIDKIDDYIFAETALLIGEDGANLVLRHLPLIYIATGKYWVNNHAHILRPKAESDLYFMAHQMEIIDYSLFITGSAQPKLSQENLNNVMLVVPPLEEQLKIAVFLNEKVTVIDEIIGNKQKQLDAMRQYKKSLIYEYVTGKKRVTEVN